MKSSTEPSVPPGPAGAEPDSAAGPAAGALPSAASGPAEGSPARAAGVPSPDGEAGPFAAGAPDPVPFWRAKTLEQMTDAEWESLCDGCGRCCLNKLEEEETGDIFWTDIACRLLDPVSCRCSSYPNRHDFVPDCVRLDVHEVVHQTYTWLPPTCAYRRLAAGRDLAWWHPLVSGDPDTVHAAGISVRNRTVSERDYDPDDVEALEERIVEWPGEDPDPRPPRRRPAPR